MSFPIQSIIQPFVDATVKTLASECLLKAEAGKPYVSKDEADDRKAETTALVHIIAHHYSVSLSFCFEETVFFAISSRILGRKVNTFSTDIDRAFARWVDAILVQVKILWPDAQNAHRTALQILKIPAGQPFRYRLEATVPAVTLPFETPDGLFRIEMSVSGLKS